MGLWPKEGRLAPHLHSWWSMAHFTIYTCISLFCKFLEVQRLHFFMSNFFRILQARVHFGPSYSTPCVYEVAFAYEVHVHCNYVIIMWSNWRLISADVKRCCYWCCFDRFQMLMSNIGKVKYPQYTISRQSKLFPDRAALFRWVVWQLDWNSRVSFLLLMNQLLFVIATVILSIYCLLVLFIQVPSVLWHCWLGGRKGIRPVKNWVVGCWRSYLSGARCRLAYGPADATATHCLLLQ